MFHSIITLVTTTAVALHALLGCCAHHHHASDEAPAETAMAAECRHDHAGHEHHHAPSPVSHDSSDENGDHQQHGGDAPCDESGCSFASVERSDDLSVVLTVARWSPVSSDALVASFAQGSPAWQPGTTAHAASDSTESLRARTQVWRL